MSKFAGKFRKSEDYEDEYFHIKKKKIKTEHSKNREFKKMRFEDDYYTPPVSLPKKFRNF